MKLFVFVKPGQFALAASSSDDDMNGYNKNSHTDDHPLPERPNDCFLSSVKNMGVIT
jgi:hypothetical protein